MKNLLSKIKINQHTDNWYYSWIVASLLFYTPLRVTLYSFGELLHAGVGFYFGLAVSTLFVVILFIPAAARTKIPADVIAWAAFLVLSWGISWLTHTQNTQFYLTEAPQVFIYALPFYYFSRKISNHGEFKQILYHAALATVTLMLFLTCLGLISNSVFEEGLTYNQFYGILTAPACVICLVASYDRKKIVFFCGFALSLLLILFFGARSPLACVLIASILLAREKGKQIFRDGLRLSWKKIGLIAAATVVVVGGVFILFSGIVETINVEKVPGLRVLAVIKYGGVAYLGPRQIIWESALDYIARHPIIGSGVIQDRLEIVKSPAVIDYFGSHLDDPSKWMGLYSHNLFLEFLMQYGWILGGIICIIVILSALGLLLDCDSEKRMVSIAVIAQTFGILLFSKSAFSYAWLWVMLGLGFPFAVAKDRASKGAVSIWNAWCYIIKRWMAVVGGALVIAVVAGFLLYLKNANPATSAGRSFLWIVVISSGFGVVASCALGLFFCILEKNRTGSRDVTIGDGVPDAEEVNAEDALISIIIPHYNVPDRLEKLLDTIPDSKDLEVIVVDDGSDQEIERFHQLKEKNAGRNVSFIDEEQNGGAGRARNIGLIKAKGEYLLFADSDDFFVENAFDRIRKAIEDHGDCDILFFPPASMKDDGSQGDRCAIYEDLVNNYLSDPSPANEARMRFLFCSPCSKLVRRRIVTDNRISYDETRFGNDMMFGVKVAFYSEKVSGVGEAIYCALEREGSLTRDFNERPLMIRRKVRMRWLAFLCKYLSFKEMHLLGYSVFVYPRLVTEFIKIKSYEIRKGKL